VTIWESPRGLARHDVRIKVCTTPGDRMDAGNTAVVAVIRSRICCWRPAACCTRSASEIFN
jgi:hypothetical protein